MGFSLSIPKKRQGQRPEEARPPGIREKCCHSGLLGQRLAHQHLQFAQPLGPVGQ